MQPEADDTCWQGRAGRDPNNVGKGCQWQLQSCKDHAVSEVVVGWQRLCPVTWQVMFMHVRLKFAPFPVCNPRLHVRHVRTREEGKLGSHDMGASDSETFFNMWLCELQAGGQKSSSCSCMMMPIWWKPSLPLSLVRGTSARIPTPRTTQCHDVLRYSAL